jgi:ribosomal protein S18 acetylase RimI-like enzyme
VTVDVRALRTGDTPALRALLEATGVFSEAEVEAAVEVIEGGDDEASPHGYRFRVADEGGAVLGYVCFGRAWFSDGTWDVYWLAVDPARQRRQVGGALLREAERAAGAGGGRTMLVETASKPSYAPARSLYERNGYVEMARIPDYYALGDDKIVYGKRLSPAGGPAPARR